MTFDDILHRFLRGAKSFFRTLLTLIVVLLIIAIGEILPPLRSLDLYLRERPGLTGFLQFLTIIMALSGALILALAQFLPRLRPPAGMSRKKLEAQSPPIKFRGDTGRTRSRFFRSIGGGFSGEASFADTKEAWRRGSWRYDHRWRLLFVMMLGAILVFFGLFGFWVVTGPPGVKFLMILVSLYALGMIAWGFARA